MICYFLPNKTDITDEIFNKSMNSNSGPSGLRESVDTLKVVLKFKCCCIPYSLMGQGYGPYTQEEVIEELDSENWIAS